jgi:L-rhamnose-H+ transport protein
MKLTVLGFFLVVLAAVAGGAIGVPLKRRSVLPIESFYLPVTITVMFALPALINTWLVPGWTSALREAAPHIGPAVLYGIAWGAGAILYGYAVTRIGLSLGCTLIMGANLICGSMVPYLKAAHPAATKDLVVLLGITGSLLGIVICGRAGYLREGSQRHRQSDWIWLSYGLCIVSGLLSSCVNLGFAASQKAVAQDAGFAGALSCLVSWTPLLFSGGVTLLAWFGGQCAVRNSWRSFLERGAMKDVGFAFLMGLFWYIATIPYGVGAYYLGRLGWSIGWAGANAISLVSVNIFGILGHEWKDASSRAFRLLLTGVSVIVLAVVTLALGNLLPNSR